MQCPGTSLSTPLDVFFSILRVFCVLKIQIASAVSRYKKNKNGRSYGAEAEQPFREK